MQTRAIVSLILLSLLLIARRFSFSFIKNENAPFLFYAVLMALFHYFMILNGDDIGYATVLQNANAVDWLIQRYNNWSSRFFVDFIIISFTALPHIFWKMFNIALFLFLAFQMNNLLNKKNNIVSSWILIFLIAIYPFYQLSSAGWIATTCSYALPLIGLVGTFVFFEKIYTEKTITHLDYIVFFLSFLCATSQEQSALILLIFICIFLFFCNKNRKFILVLFVLNIILLSVILFAPGNWIRIQSETKTWFPAFANFNIVQKISIGIFATANVFLKDQFLILILSFSLLVLTFQNYKEKYLRCLASVQIFVILFFCVAVILNSTLKLAGVQIETLTTLSQLIKQDNNYIIADLSFYFVCYLTIMISWYLIIFYLILKNSKNNYLLLFVFVMGLFSKAIMGFSPTVFASSDRTAVFAYFTLIAVDFYFVKIIFERSNFFTQRNIILALLAMLSINAVRSILITLINQKNIQSSDIGLFLKAINFNALDIIFLIVLFTTILFIYCIRPYFKNPRKKLNFLKK